VIETEGVVVDASALVELVIEGEHRAGADALLDRYRTVDRLVLVSAAHGLIEATSAIQRLTQRGALSPEQGSQSISWLGQIDLVLDATGPRLRRA
jgi:predicted nucleic acid-binding protein